MTERVDKPELVHQLARRLDRDDETVAEIVDGFLKEIYAALKCGDNVSLRGFGSFYVRAERHSWVFKCQGLGKVWDCPVRTTGRVARSQVAGTSLVASRERDWRPTRTVHDLPGTCQFTCARPSTSSRPSRNDRVVQARPAGAVSRP
jgi:DNA-binding protein HU-beta